MPKLKKTKSPEGFPLGDVVGMRYAYLELAAKSGVISRATFDPESGVLAIFNDAVSEELPVAVLRDPSWDSLGEYPYKRMMVIQLDPAAAIVISP